MTDDDDLAEELTMELANLEYERLAAGRKAVQP
jgi:hypothetical protein